MRLLFFRKIVSKFILSACIGLLIYNFKFSADLWLTIGVSWAYVLAGSFMRWLKYNRHPVMGILAFYLCSSLLFVLAFCYATIPVSMLLVAVCVCILCYTGKAKIHWDKYYEDAVYTAKLNHASRSNNLAEMQQIAADHIAKKSHCIRIYHFPLSRKNALFFKALIETFRMSKQVLILLGLLLVFAVLINRTTLCAGIPLLDNPSFSRIVGMCSVGTFCANVKQLYAKQIAALYEKHTLGLFVPYGYKTIVYCYGLVCCFSTTFVLAILCGILLPGWMRSAFVILLCNLVMVVSFLVLKKSRANRYVDFLLNLLFILGSGLLF
jgi:uncharacterized membrane protein